MRARLSVWIVIVLGVLFFTFTFQHQHNTFFIEVKEYSEYRLCTYRINDTSVVVYVRSRDTTMKYTRSLSQAHIKDLKKYLKSVKWTLLEDSYDNTTVETEMKYDFGIHTYALHKTIRVHYVKVKELVKLAEHLNWFLPDQYDITYPANVRADKLYK